MDKIRIGIVGIGDHCLKSHVPYLLELSDLCTITAFCDLDYRKSKLLKNVPNSMALHTKFDEFIVDDSFDAVLIMTPDYCHTEQLVAAVEAGKHVFCEKPLATTRKEYEQLVTAFALADEKKLIVTTCHPRRFDTPFEVVRGFINNGKIFDQPLPGKILNFEFYFHYSRPSKTGLHPSLMYDHLNHEVDAMHYLFGTGKIKHAVKHYDSETAFHVTGLRQDGISFSFIGQRKMRSSETYPEYMKINFEGGSLQIDLFKGEATLLSGKAYTTWFNPAKCKTDYSKRFHAINRNFLESILQTAVPYLTAEEMLINTELAIDLNEKIFVEY